MKQLFSFVFVSLISVVSLAQSNAYFLSNPTLSPDGQTIVFAFEGDLWKANISDGQATRLTAMQGYETSPRISPDGKWIAFTGRQYGNADVYLMPVNGGEVKQITFHSGNDEVTSWSWDSKSLYFNSGRMGQVAGFKVIATGGTPQSVFGSNFF
jgi:Tol biopolymer transport system component